MIRELTIQYALAIAYERRPDVTRTLQGAAANDSDRWTRADQMGERLRQAVLRISDLAQKPANVGGVVHAKAGSDDGPGRIFDDMGRF